jgi:hypothetical protein
MSTHRDRRDDAIRARIGEDRWASLLESRRAARAARPLAERVAKAEALRAKAATAVEIAAANARLLDLGFEARNAVTPSKGTT